MRWRFFVRRVRWTLRMHAWDQPVWMNEWERRKKRLYDTTYAITGLPDD